MKNRNEEMAIKLTAIAVLVAVAVCAFADDTDAKRPYEITLPQMDVFRQFMNCTEFA